MSECGKKIGTIVASGVEQDVVCGLEAHGDDTPHEAKSTPPKAIGRTRRPEPKAEDVKAKEG